MGQIQYHHFRPKKTVSEMTVEERKEYLLNHPCRQEVLGYYVNCVKIPDLPFPKEIKHKCYESLDVYPEFDEFGEEFELIFRKIVTDFQYRNGIGSSITFAGKNRGWLQLSRDVCFRKGFVTIPMEEKEFDENLRLCNYDIINEQAELLYDFDKTCDEIISTFENLIKQFVFEEREIKFIQLIKVSKRIKD